MVKWLVSANFLFNVQHFNCMAKDESDCPHFQRSAEREWTSVEKMLRHSGVNTFGGISQ